MKTLRNTHQRIHIALPLILLALNIPFQTCALEVRIASFNVLFGVNAPGSSEYNAVRDILQRVDPDVVAFQELTNSDNVNWVALAAELNYPHLAFGTGGPFAGTQRLGFFSRHPITEAEEVKEPAGASEISRWPLRVVIDVPGALNPLVAYAVHNKALSGSVNQFRRSIELHRTLSNLVQRLDSHPMDTEIVILGDFNDDVSSPQTLSFSSLPSGLPGSYTLGADITFPVPYSLYPTDRCAATGLSEMPLFQEDTMNDATYPESGGRLDYIYFSSDIMNNPLGQPQGEVYHSLEDDGVGGLAKSGAPLAPETSTNASDHLLIFSDFHMIDALPCLNPVLFVSEVMDHPSLPNANYVELYNSGASSLDITGFEVILHYAGGSATTNTLSGSMAPGDTLTLAADLTTFSSTYGIPADQEFIGLQTMDGNDSITIKNASGLAFDVYGEVGQPASSTNYNVPWAYQDQHAKRVLGISDPLATWMAGEWVITNQLAEATPDSHVACDQADVIIVGPTLNPQAPEPGTNFTIQAEIRPNLPASNLMATAHYAYNGGSTNSVAMSLSAGNTWTTPTITPTASEGDILTYSIEVNFSGFQGALEQTLSGVNSNTFISLSTTAPIYFNEVRSDDAGADDEEFFELIAPAGTILTDCYVEHYNGDGSPPALWRFTFPPFTVPDDGITDDEGTPLGFVVVGTSNSITNLDFLVDETFQNGPDGLILFDANNRILDAVAWQGPGNMIVDNPGNVFTTLSSSANSYLHVIPDDQNLDDSIQAGNDVLADTGQNWMVLDATPGTINSNQTSGSIILGTSTLPDGDGDGVLDDVDNCVGQYNPLQTDIDQDGLGDVCDPDMDNDGIDNSPDNCPSDVNPLQEDMDGDGIGDACDPDLDGDGIENELDLCPSVPNPGQEDFDMDGVGDVCDDDIDGDNVLDTEDNCLLLANPGQEDPDMDGLGNPCDDDINNDGYIETLPHAFFNEVQARHSSTGELEYIELIGPAGLDLTNWKIIHYNGSASSDSPIWQFTFSSFSIPDDGVIDINGTPLGFVLIAESLAPSLNPDFTLPGVIQDGEDGLVLYDAMSNVIDAVAWEGPGDLIDDNPGNLFTNTLPWSDTFLNVTPDDSSSDNSLQAPNDVLGILSPNWSIHPPTPGMLNTNQQSGSLVLVALDTDEDGILNITDNCVTNYNPNQLDLDLDGLGNACDTDIDGDGVSNVDEAIADTNPEDAGSLLKIISIAYDHILGDSMITFLSSTNRQYEIEYNDLDGPGGTNWYTGSPSALPGLHPNTLYIDTNAGAILTTNRYYRVRVLP